MRELRAAARTLCDFAGRFSAGDIDVQRGDLQVAIDDLRAALSQGAAHEERGLDVERLERALVAIATRDEPLEVDERLVAIDIGNGPPGEIAADIAAEYDRLAATPAPTTEEPDPLITAIENALSDTVKWRRPAWMSDTVQSLVAAGDYRQAARVMAPRIRSLVDVPATPAPTTEEPEPA